MAATPSPPRPRPRSTTSPGPAAFLISFAMAIVGLVGIAFGRGNHRLFAASLTVARHGARRWSSPIRRFVAARAPAHRRQRHRAGACPAAAARGPFPSWLWALRSDAAALVERVPARRVPWPSLGHRATWRRLFGPARRGAPIINMPRLWRPQLVDPAIDRADAELPPPGSMHCCAHRSGQ